MVALLVSAGVDALQGEVDLIEKVLVVLGDSDFYGIAGGPIGFFFDVGGAIRRELMVGHLCQDLFTLTKQLLAEIVGMLLVHHATG